MAAVAPWKVDTFVTDNWRGWMMKYMTGVVKELSKMINKECSLEEQTLWNLFTEFDANLDSVFDKNEMDQLFRNLDPDCTDITVETYQQALEACASRPGECTFVDFCKWWHVASTDDESPAAHPALKMLILARAAKNKGKSMFGAFVSSNVDDRYDAAEPAVLEALLPQYRTALTDIRLWHVELRLKEADEFTGWECAKKLYEAIRDMLPQDEKVLWEVFCEHDKSLNGDLDRSEMEELLLELDKSASPKEIEQQYKEMTNGEDKDITFVDMLKWWLTCDKGGSLYAQMGLKIAASKVKQFGFNLISTPPVEKLWKEAAASTIADTIVGYKRVAVELCSFRTKHLLEDAEKYAAATGIGK